jgi:hypothetical protein
MVESAPEKQQLPEAPISITVMAYYEGFQVLITRRTGELLTGLSMNLSSTLDK